MSSDVSIFFVAQDKQENGRRLVGIPVGPVRSTREQAAADLASMAGAGGCYVVGMTSLDDDVAAEFSSLLAA